MSRLVFALASPIQLAVGAMLRACRGGRLRLACAGLALIAGLPLAQAQPVEYQAGVHYRELSDPLADRDPERIEITELFWYGCPSCYDLLPTLQLWEASYRSADMSFERLPVIWNAAMETHARLFLTADELGLLPPVNKSAWEVVPSIHNGFFDALQRQHQALGSEAEIASLFESWGAAPASFRTAWESDEVAARLEELKALPALSEIPSLPALVVHGRYLVTFNDAVTTTEELFKVMNHLVVKVRKER